MRRPEVVALRHRVPPRLAPSAAALILAVATATIPRPSAAAEGAADFTGAAESRNWLDRPIWDLAALDPSGPDGAPRLLAIAADGSAPQGVVRLRILRRDRTWEPDDELSLDLRATGVSGVGVPWLIGLGATRFAVISTTPSEERSSVVVIGTDAGPGRSRLAELARTTMDFPIDDAGAADVDGDGTIELVLASARSDRTGGACRGSQVAILDEGLTRTGGFEVTGRRLAGGVLGQWDDAPGADLLAYAYPDCPAAANPATDRGLMAVRLSDGATIVERASGGQAKAPPWVGAPVRLDVDGDGRDEALVNDGDALVALDPVRGWTSLSIGTADGLPLAAFDAFLSPDVSDGRPRVAWLEPGDGVAGGRLATGRLVRDAQGEVAIDAVGNLGDGTASDRWAAMVRGAWQSARLVIPPVAWLGDLGDPACLDLLLVLARQACRDSALSPGAAWLATRPLLTLGDGPTRRILVAGGLGWTPSEGPPPTPAPWLAAPGGWWRHGPSAPFALSELRAADTSYFREFPRPRATLERTADPDRTTGLPGFTGARIFVRMSTASTDVLPAGPNPALLSALTAPAGSDERLLTTRIDVPPGLEAGRDGGFASVDLGTGRLPNGTPAPGWRLTVVSINDWGEAGVPVAGFVARDVIGPSLMLESPMTTPIWPFSARLAGASEPGTTVEVEGLGRQALDRRGRFTVETTLWPWPQTIRLRATDGSGNVTVRDVSLVGGVDYRRFPWPTILAAVLLIFVAGSGLLGTRRRRTRGEAAVSSEGRWAPAIPTAEIEELPPGGGLPLR